MRIAHVSDFHFSKITLNPLQFFSKRWIGNANLIFKRKKRHKTAQLQKLPELFSDLQVDTVIFSGDASTTNRKIEFEHAKQLKRAFIQRGMKVLCLPGNHDHYTKSAYKEKVFYKYLENDTKGPFSLEKDGIEVGELLNNWYYILLDTSLATPTYSSQGLFSEELEEKLEKVLQTIPSSARILIANHFPFFQYVHPRNILKRGMALHDVLKRWPKIQLYLHGHTHIHTTADLRIDNLPIILDSGSSSDAKIGTFNLLDIDSEKMDLNVYKIQKGSWKESEKNTFYWF